MMLSRTGSGPRPRTRRPAVVAILAATTMVAVAACGGGGLATTTTGYVAPTYKDWPVFGRDQDATFYAPQTEISASTVSKLGVAWSKNLGPNQYLDEGYPIEIGGTLYVTTSSDEVQAYDAVSGRLKWQYAPQVNFSQSTGIGGYGVTTNRGVAVSNGKVFELTFDDHLEALSAGTGEELWSSAVADETTGAYETMAPTVYNGLVMVGISGSQDGIRGFVAAYSQSTGKQVWRFYTVPAAGHGWVPSTGGGGGVYMPPTVDAIYGADRKGADLYTDTILALNAHTGKLAWHYQEVPHDVWNYGAASPVMIVSAGRNGTTAAVAEAGKDGHVYILNAKTGQPLFTPEAYVTVDNPRKVPTTKGTLVCPGATGGSPYSPMALDPQANAVYVSGVNICQVLKVELMATGGEKEFGGVRFTPIDEAKTGTFDAVDLATGKFLWKRNMPTPMIGGAVATGSNLVFTGDQAGILYAMNASTGKTVWEGHLGLAFGSAPIVYTIAGVEYIAAAIGGSASTAASHLGKIGARIVVLRLGGKSIS
jgi:alcohol dehydrogenase (cytochrome c)